MSQTKDTTSIKDPDDQLIEILARQVLELLVRRELLAPFTAADGTVKYRKTQTFNRLYLQNRWKRDRPEEHPSKAQHVPPGM